MTKKIKAPSSILIETVAGQLAATWYEIGRGQGMTSKYHDARAYAKANLEKFIPKAVDHLLDMLGSNIVSADEKKMIFEALQERRLDTETTLPDIDISKLIPTKQEKPIIINTEKKPFDINNMPLPIRM